MGVVVAGLADLTGDDVTPGVLTLVGAAPGGLT